LTGKFAHQPTNFLETKQFGDTDGKLELNVFLITFKTKNLKKITAYGLQKDNSLKI